MHILKRIFRPSGNPNGQMNRRFYVDMPNGRVPSVYVDAKADPRQVLALLGIKGLPRPALFITGGASKMSDEDKRLTRALFEDAIAPFAQRHNIVVIDGGTKSGVIEMMATARLKGNFTFPLVGVAPHSKVTYPDKPAGSSGEHPLCPGHSHFAFVTGDDYGWESEMIVNMAHVLAGGQRDRAGRARAALGIVVNGGSITRQEALMATSKYIDIPLVVMEGSGRFADELASAVRTGETSQALIRSIIDRGNVQLASSTHDADALQQQLENAFQDMSHLP